MQIDTVHLMQLDSLRVQTARSKIDVLERKTVSAAAEAAFRKEVQGRFPSLPEEKNGSEDPRLRQACKDFQAIFVKQMLDTMRKTLHKDGILQGGQAEEIFEDMLYDEYAKKISNNAGLGLDDMIYVQLSTRRPDF